MSRPATSLAEWLNSLGLGEYFELFSRDGYDMPTLLSATLTEDDLQALGITLGGHRKKILVSLRELRANPPPTRSPSVSNSLPSVLPPDWKEAKDERGRVYFWNKTTKEVSWDRPTAAPAIAAVPSYAPLRGKSIPSALESQHGAVVQARPRPSRADPEWTVVETPSSKTDYLYLVYVDKAKRVPPGSHRLALSMEIGKDGKERKQRALAQTQLVTHDGEPRFAEVFVFEAGEKKHQSLKVSLFAGGTTLEASAEVGLGTSRAWELLMSQHPGIDLGRWVRMKRPNRVPGSSEESLELKIAIRMILYQKSDTVEHWKVVSGFGALSARDKKERNSDSRPVKARSIGRVEGQRVSKPEKETKGTLGPSDAKKLSGISPKNSIGRDAGKRVTPTPSPKGSVGAAEGKRVAEKRTEKPPAAPAEKIPAERNPAGDTSSARSSVGRAATRPSARPREPVVVVFPESDRSASEAEDDIEPPEGPPPHPPAQGLVPPARPRSSSTPSPRDQKVAKSTEVSEEEDGVDGGITRAEVKKCLEEYFGKVLTAPDGWTCDVLSSKHAGWNPDWVTFYHVEVHWTSNIKGVKKAGAEKFTVGRTREDRVVKMINKGHL